MLNITKVTEQNDELQMKLERQKKRYETLKNEKEEEIQKLKNKKR